MKILLRKQNLPTVSFLLQSLHNFKQTVPSKFLCFSVMAFIFLFIILLTLNLFSLIQSSTVVQDLNNLKPPPDFNATIAKNCHQNPNLRYCNSVTPINLPQIFKFTIVASHLCNESRNPNCVDSFPKIDLRNRPKLAPLYLSFSFFWQYCPLTILSIDLSNNSLNLNFPNDILLCTQIKNLDLSHNSFHGDVPVDKLSLLPNLTLLNLSYNSFSESRISDTQFLNRFNSSSFLHSGLLPDRRKYKIKAMILLFMFPVSVIIMVILFGWLCFRRPDYLPALFRRNHMFTPSILSLATREFSERNLVGRTRVLDIYRGELRDGREVRIEIFWENLSRENRKNFADECKMMVKLDHKNLVRIIGYCNNRKLRAVIAEWVGEESVEMWLIRSDPAWKQRVKIIMGVLEGIFYLAEEFPEIRYDLKTSSILLYEGREPLISRFKFGPICSISKKIYKFGIFMLEIISNKRPREEFESGDAGFVEWVKINYAENGVDKVMDEKIKKKVYAIEQVDELIRLGLKCTSESSMGQQPSLNQVYDTVSRIYRSSTGSTSHLNKKVHKSRI